MLKPPSIPGWCCGVSSPANSALRTSPSTDLAAEDMLHAAVLPHVSQGLTRSRNEMQLQCPKRSAEGRSTHRKCMHAWQRDDTVMDEHAETRQRGMSSVLFPFSTFIFIRQMNAWKRWPRNETTYCSDFQWKQTISWLAQSAVQFVLCSHFVPRSSGAEQQRPSSGTLGHATSPSLRAGQSQLLPARVGLVFQHSDSRACGINPCQRDSDEKPR